MLQHQITNNIFIPKYYDPTIARRIDELASTHNMVRLGDLVDNGDLELQSGHDIGKMTYGTGNVPFVRTSDLATWEIVSAPKQTVSDAVFHSYTSRQDVEPGDLLFVKDGQYLIGSCAMVAAADLPLLYQSHLLRIRVAPGSMIPPALLLLLLSTPIVRRQVRSKQFTAGIIDKIEHRFRELMLPLPLDGRAALLDQEVLSLVHRRAELREILRSVPHWAQGEIDHPGPQARASHVPAPDGDRFGFLRHTTGLTGGILIPKYYDPTIAADLSLMDGDYRLQTIGNLVDEGTISVSTGMEVGKLAYGTGLVPFVRTTDLADWELRGAPKQRISEDIYNAFRHSADVQARDILLVRDGTYLVGTSAIVTSRDTEMLFASGLYKLRCEAPDRLNPYLLLALINMPIVKRQIRSKQFTRDIIDTVGRRLFEVVLPIPRSMDKRVAIAETTEAAVEERVRLRDRAKELAIAVEGRLDAEERELVEAMPL